MKNYIKHDPWKIIEEGFRPEYNEISESLFSLGNGRFGLRGNFEETFTGKTLQGSYLAGVYYPDKTKVGWWKNGYPEYFAKVLNAANWIGIRVEIDNHELDLNTCKVSNFIRILNMKEGYLSRSFTAEFSDGKQVQVETKRLCSIVEEYIGTIQFSIKPLNFSGEISLTPFIDFDVVNKDSNYDEKFWEEKNKGNDNNIGWVTAVTKKTKFVATSGMIYEIFKGDTPIDSIIDHQEKEKYIGHRITLNAEEGQAITLNKYCCNLTSLNYSEENIVENCMQYLNKAKEKGYDKILSDQAEAWEKKWAESDIQIEGDVAAQQGIRFNIFHLYQTYTGTDERLNIGPKGFTGEKYGGSTYWDTEAYCLPFYLATSEEKVGRQLLVYRYKHLQKAIENAEKLGFSRGAALYPMVTMNGEECHNEWEITFEEIHRNGAIAYGIFDYIRYTGDKNYLAEYGLEVLLGISRFWSQRITFSTHKNKYVMLGVTGPNEYENNVDNNWYTNYIATWCLKYTLESLDWVKTNFSEKYTEFSNKTNFAEAEETERWRDIISNMYYPKSEELGIFLQQDNYLDKEQIMAKDIPEDQIPIWQNWSWDRILRSCFIKQGDVLQGMYFFEDHFDRETIRKNYDFYEPRTVHESSLSPCIHAVIASKIGDKKRAYQFYLRTSRLDLDDYNNDTEDGLHITSMAGSWLAVVKGFGGMRVSNGQVSFAPFIPENWTGYAFKIRFRGSILKIEVKENKVYISNESDKQVDILLYNKNYAIKANETIKAEAIPGDALA